MKELKEYFIFNKMNGQAECNNETVGLYTDSTLTQLYKPPYAYSNRTLFPMIVELNSTEESSDTNSTQYLTIHYIVAKR